MADEKKYEWYNQIVGPLYVGGIPFYRGAPNYDISKFDWVVLCADNAQYVGSEFLFKHAKLLRCPLEDSATPFTEKERLQIKKTVADIARRARAGERMLITCVAGVNRSAMICALTMLEMFPAIPADEIIDRIRSKRKLDVGEALFNDAFVKYIHSWRERK